MQKASDWWIFEENAGVSRDAQTKNQSIAKTTSKKRASLMRIGIRQLALWFFYSNLVLLAKRLSCRNGCQRVSQLDKYTCKERKLLNGQPTGNGVGESGDGCC